MSKEQEAQQAQTIAEIKKKHCAQYLSDEEHTASDIHNDRGDLLKIVDSKAQKIAEQEKRIAELEKAAEFYVRKIESWGI